MVVLFLVRHGRPLVDRSRPAHDWELDPAGYDDVRALGGSGRLPQRAVWFSSPELRAVETARLLTEEGVAVVDDLREHVRDSRDWIEDFETVVRAAFAEPDLPAYPGWATLASCRDRVVPAVRDILEAHQDADVVLVGHGTAWTLVVSALTGEPPDLEAWQRLAMPDVIVVERP